MYYLPGQCKHGDVKDKTSRHPGLNGKEVQRLLGPRPVCPVEGYVRRWCRNVKLQDREKDRHATPTRQDTHRTILVATTGRRRWEGLERRAERDSKPTTVAMTVSRCEIPWASPKAPQLDRSVKSGSGKKTELKNGIEGKSRSRRLLWGVEKK